MRSLIFSYTNFQYKLCRKLTRICDRGNDYATSIEWKDSYERKGLEGDKETRKEGRGGEGEREVRRVMCHGVFNLAERISGTATTFYSTKGERSKV